MVLRIDSSKALEPLELSGTDNGSTRGLRHRLQVLYQFCDYQDRFTGMGLSS